MTACASARRKSLPKQLSAYLVTWSNEPAMPVGGILIDKGALLERDWNVIDFDTGAETGAVGRRLARLCPDCRFQHQRVGILGHDGECGTQEVTDEAKGELNHAKKRIEVAS